MDNLSSLSENKKEFKTPAMKIPVVFHASENLLPNQETFDQLENLAKDERLFDHIAAMSDVHPKKGRKCPTGTVVASENYLLPQINDTAPNCGMRFLKTNFNENNLSLEKIDELFQELVKVVPTKKRRGVEIPSGLTLDIARLGSAPLVEHLKSKTKNEIENSYKAGNFFDKEEITNREILDVIPRLFLKVAKYRLGILGAAGNHFLDLMKISEIQDENIAQKFGIQKGQYVFLMHTGSGLIGQYASYMYTPKIKEHQSQKLMLKLGILTFDSQLKKVYKHLYEKIKRFENSKDFFGYDERHLEGRMFIRAHRVAANFGFANRVMLTDQIEKVLKKIMGPGSELDLLYDTPHISVEKENHLGQDIWIHRNGSVRALGPIGMKNHPVFSLTGEPVFIPSSMTTPAYIGVGTDENASTFFSAPHGTGRKKISENNIPKDKKDLFKKVEDQNVRLYNAASKGVLLQDSAYYKNVDEVVSGMVDNKIIKVVAKMEPVAVIMY